MNTFLLIFVLTASLFASPETDPFYFQESNDCVKKSSSEWGSNCGACHNSAHSYRVNLKNTCTKNIDMKVAVQEKSNRWRTFSQSNVAPGDSISAYACEGTGKYVFWSRPAGDKTVVFPTDDEVNKEFSNIK